MVVHRMHCRQTKGQQVSGPVFRETFHAHYILCFANKSLCETFDNNMLWMPFFCQNQIHIMWKNKLKNL